jgi:hypothetical protein
VYVVKQKPGRSGSEERFVRELDAERQRIVQFTGRWAERTRVIPAEGKPPSAFLRLPYDVPIDYYDPAFFNSLPPNIRRAIIGREARIALAPRSCDFFVQAENDPSRRLTDRVYMKTFGAAALMQYNIPGSDVEPDPDQDDLLTQGGATADDDDDDAVMGRMVQEEEDEEMLQQRARLANQIDTL